MSNSLELRKKPGIRNNYYLKAFSMGFLLALIIFIPFIIIDGGRFLFYGDFNVQQVPFYRLAHDAIRSGNFGWNQYTDLGVNFIGSYSFYLFGSPFFWLTIPFPSEWLKYLMGPLFILKFACATLTGYIFLRRYVKNQDFAIIGAILYAFSGYSIYNIFFNHFHEAIVFFPLMLAALDEYMYTRKRGIFALSVAACCIVNYYFFVGQVTFTLIYFFLRLICKSWKITFKEVMQLGLEAVLGVGISCVVFIPSIMTVLQNYRTSNVINGWDAVLYNKNQRYLHILSSFFFVPDLPARPNLTPDSGSKWASIGAWLPLFSMTGVIGWLQIKRKHWLKKMLWILFLMAFVPFLNSSFQMLNGSYYARWFYMLTLMMSLATIMALEYSSVNWKRSITWTFVITGAISLVLGLMPTISTAEDGTKTYEFGLVQYTDRFWTYVAISLICLAVVVYLFQFHKHNPFKRKNQKHFYRISLVALCLTVVLYSIYFISIGKAQTEFTYKHIIPYALNGGADIKLEDVRDDDVRTDFYESLDNSAMFWGVKSIQAFHSIVPGSIMEFYDAIGVQRDVASRPDTTHYALRGLTSVKWLFDNDDDEDYFMDSETSETEMPGWLYHSNANGFDIYKNEYYISMGFTYEGYVTSTDFYKLSESQRELIMLKALVVDDSQENLVSTILPKMSTSDFEYTKEAYFNDCIERASNTATSFEYTNSGFNAEFRTNAETIVFFSVPYEDGWTAYVNGAETEIIKSNVGFMSVAIPEGENVHIEFRYSTPGLRIGILVSAVSVFILLTYLLITRRSRKKEKLALAVNHSNRKTLLKPRKFSTYSDTMGAKFQRDKAMVPKEFMIPEPPDGSNDLIEDDFEINDELHSNALNENLETEDKDE